MFVFVQPSSKGQKSNCEIQKKERAVKPLGRDDLLKIREKANKENQSEPSARVEANIPAPPAEVFTFTHIPLTDNSPFNTVSIIPREYGPGEAPRSFTLCMKKTCENFSSIGC